MKGKSTEQGESQSMTSANLVKSGATHIICPLRRKPPKRAAETAKVGGKLATSAAPRRKKWDMKYGASNLERDPRRYGWVWGSLGTSPSHSLAHTDGSHRARHAALDKSSGGDTCPYQPSRERGLRSECHVNRCGVASEPGMCSDGTDVRNSEGRL